MPQVFLESSVLIGLHFRNAGEREACRRCLPPGSEIILSRYVIFEIARGFLRALLTLHNSSYEHETLSDINLAAQSGQVRYRPYEMAARLGYFVDFQAALEEDGDAYTEEQRLHLFRANLLNTVEIGWDELNAYPTILNSIGCRDVLPNPEVTDDGMVFQHIPLQMCGQPRACGLKQFVEARRHEVGNLVAYIDNLPAAIKRDADSDKHAACLRELLRIGPNDVFKAKFCYKAGDALLSLEAPRGAVVATKNERDFKPLLEHLQKDMSVAISARTTRSDERQHRGTIGRWWRKKMLLLKQLFGLR